MPISGAVDPLVGAVGEPLVLPDRQPRLRLIDQPPARLDRRPRVGARPRGHDRRAPALARPDAVPDRARLHGFVRRDLLGDLGQHLLGARVSLVVERGHRTAVVVVAYHPLEANYSARAGPRHPLLVRRDVERAGRHVGLDHATHGRSPTFNGSGTNPTRSPALPSVPGGITAKPSAWATPRSIDDPWCLSGIAVPWAVRTRDRWVSSPRPLMSSPSVTWPGFGARRPVRPAISGATSDISATTADCGLPGRPAIHLVWWPVSARARSIGKPGRTLTVL